MSRGVGSLRLLVALGLILTFGLAPALEVDGDPAAPLAGKILGTEIRTGDPEELRYWVLRGLTDRYAAEKGIEVTPGDIEAYLAGMARLAEQDRAERQARQAEIERQLASATVSEEERAALSSELDSLRQLQGDLDEMSGDQGEDAEEARQARETVAAAFIRQWKINRALYEQYGGRIIFQQGGPEPLDAYRGFLEERQAEGDFALLDPGMETGFWRYYTTDAIHSFYPPGSDEEAQAFQTPWWLADHESVD